MSVIQKEAKQRRDSIEQFKKGAREDLATAEEKELAILKIYLPAVMSKDDILRIAQAKKEELGMTDASKIGVLIGAILKETKGQAEGKDVKEVVEGLFK